MINTKHILLVYLVTLASGLYSDVTISYNSSYIVEKEKNSANSIQYIKSGLSRIEHSIKIKKDKNKSEEQKTITIIRTDKKLIWTIIPEQKGYCEFTFDELKKYSNKKTQIIPDVTFKKRGIEKFTKLNTNKKIAGVKCNEYVYKNDKEETRLCISEDSKIKEVEEFYLQLNSVYNIDSKENGIPLEIKSKKEDSEYHNIVKDIKFDKISNELFEIPKDYSRLNKDVWENYSKNFDTENLIKGMKQQIKEELKEKVKEEGKEAVKKGVKNLIGF